MPQFKSLLVGHSFLFNTKRFVKSGSHSAEELVAGRPVKTFSGNEDVELNRPAFVKASPRKDTAR